MELQIIQNIIYEIRGLKVILDKDLAFMYEVSTGNMNKAVKRNADRFPDDFMFQPQRLWTVNEHQAHLN